MYEPSMRVPLLAYCPELIKPGTKVPQLVQNIDIAPTVLAAAGAEPPQHMDGRSILPLLAGKDTPWRGEVFYEYYWEANFPHTPTTFGVRTDRYKLIHYHGVWETDELYDMQNDPDERNNLIDKPEHRTLVADLRKRMYDWLEKTNGMQIPLRREVGGKSDKRGPKATTEFKFHEESQ
jgi:N-acetylglucosamine-6-sulfatase